MRKALMLLSGLFTLPLWAQVHTVNGYVTDSKSGESIIFAYVYDEYSGLGTRTNDYGFYSLSLNADSAKIKTTYIGYYQQEKTVTLYDADVSLDFELIPDNVIDEVLIEVNAAEAPPIHEESQMSTVRLDIAQVRNLPVLLGETDLLKTIQLLPGVQSGSEGSSGFYVRGGGPDQNLVLVDGVPVYNVSHLFGFFSIFNGDAVKSVELIKGGFPAEYGGRLSSVLDIRMKEGNMREFHGEGSIGLISSKLTLEGPIWEDNTSFIVSARRTYIDVLAAPLVANATDGANAGYYFYDVNAKVNHRFNNDHHLYLSMYNGRDEFSAGGEEETRYDGYRYIEKFNAGINWGNTIGSLRWNWRLNSKLFLNTTATYTRYKFNVLNEFDETVIAPDDTEVNSFFGAEYLSDIEDYGVRWDFDWFPTADHEVKFGAAYINHTFRPGISTLRIGGDTTGETSVSFGSSNQYANEVQLYIRDDWEITDRLKANIGLHASGFNVNGETYTSLQPRLSARYLIDEYSSVKASYANMTQFLHLLTNQTTGLPTDLWVPATDDIRPQQSWQVAVGYAHTLPKNFQVSIEGYYKEMSNLIEYKEGAGFFLGSQDWQDKVTTGDGTSYGVELLIERKVGKATGWIGYTWSRSTRQFDEVNFGNPYPYTYDRRHDFSLAFTYDLSDKWTLGTVFVYGTGNAVTLPTARYIDPSTGTLIEHVSGRNNYRAPAYHRWDISMTRTKKTSWGESIWQFGVYNVYSRQNPFYLYFGSDGNGNRSLNQVSLFPILPSVSWAFKF